MSGNSGSRKTPNRGWFGGGPGLRIPVTPITPYLWGHPDEER